MTTTPPTRTADPSQNGRHRRPARARVALGLTAAALVFAACGGSDDSATPAPVADAAGAAEAPVTTAAPAPASPATPSATGTDSELGEILAGENGLTLYGFTNDIDAVSTCYGTCAEAWPPVIVDPGWQVAPGLDEGIFATTTRDDGQLQLVAGKWPLYYFAGDATAGDLNGQGSGDVWFVVGTDGILITGEEVQSVDAETAAPEEAAPSAVVGIDSTDAGDVLVDANGLSLYGFTPDEAGAPTCGGACAEAWPPLLVPSADLPDGLDPEVFSVVEGLEGGFQLKAGIWPLYTFAGDAAPGDINGQGSGGNWFLAAPDGTLITGDEPAAAEASSIVDTGSSDAGEVLVDANGLSLYGFTPDEAGAPTCGGACAEAWPPVMVDSAELPAGLDPEVFSVVEGLEGGWQLKAGIWPLYTFAGDAAPGDINGQGSGGNWFLAAPDGTLITGDEPGAASSGGYGG